MRTRHRSEVGRRYLLSEITGTITDDQLEMLAGSGVDGIAVFDAGRDVVERVLDVASGLSITYLELDVPRIPQLPSDLLQGLEVLLLGGRYSRLLEVTSLRRIRSLTASRGVRTAGGFAAGSDVEQVALGHYDGTDLREVDGCARLASLKIQGRHQMLTPRWSAPPSQLTNLVVFDAYLSTLEAMRGLPNLTGLEVDVSRRRRPLPWLDLHDLADCSKLEWLQLWRAAHLRGVDALAGLPALTNVVVEEGGYEPVDLEGLPVTVVPARGVYRGL